MRRILNPVPALAALLWMACAVFSRAGESGLTKTYQPLSGLGDDRIEIASVSCHDWYAQGSSMTAFGLISARNIPPTNAPRAIEDINMASIFGLRVDAIEKERGAHVVILNCLGLRLDHDYEPLVYATLECVRRVAAERGIRVRVEGTLKLKGQEGIRTIIDQFNAHPKEKEFSRK
jgi:hypothetical protein